MNGHGWREIQDRRAQLRRDWAITIGVTVSVVCGLFVAALVFVR